MVYVFLCIYLKYIHTCFFSQAISDIKSRYFYIYIYFFVYFQEKKRLEKSKAKKGRNKIKT